MRPPTIGTIPGRADDPARTRTALRVVFVTAYYPPYSVGGGSDGPVRTARAGYRTAARDLRRVS